MPTRVFFFFFFSSIPDDIFEYGNDIQIFYSLYKTLTLEDLAKIDAKHTVIGLARVINKALKHLNNLSVLENYFFVVGRIHDSAGVDLQYLRLCGVAFAEAVEQILSSTVRQVQTSVLLIRENAGFAKKMRKHSYT